jgi:hypothetical protein
MVRPQVLRRRWNLGYGLKEFPPWGRFSTRRGELKALPKILKVVVLWSALAAIVATFAFPASIHAAPEENIAIATLLKGGWQVAGYTSTLDGRSAFILFRHPDEPYLVQCRASYDVTRTPPVTSNCYKLQ